MIISFNFRELVTGVTYTLVNESGLDGSPVAIADPLFSHFYIDDVEISDDIIAIVWNYTRTEDAQDYEEIVQRDYFSMQFNQPTSGEVVAPLSPNTLWQHKLNCA